ncbi:hypothetical protein PQR05_03915 [Paraburkholderia sediminicola]|uniref:hypothetical protein n=1 Tax=Paraburkholderia sediminicola TaxID=458836 RepID=UPI0038B71ED9
MNSYENSMMLHPRVREESRDEYWNRQDEHRRHEQRERQDGIRHRARVDRPRPQLMGPFNGDVAPQLLTIDDTVFALLALAQRDGQAHFHAHGGLMCTVELERTGRDGLTGKPQYSPVWTMTGQCSTEDAFRKALQAARTCRG